MTTGRPASGSVEGAQCVQRRPPIVAHPPRLLLPDQACPGAAVDQHPACRRPAVIGDPRTSRRRTEHAARLTRRRRLRQVGIRPALPADQSQSLRKVEPLEMVGGANIVTAVVFGDDDVEKDRQLPDMRRIVDNAEGQFDRGQAKAGKGRCARLLELRQRR